MKGNFKRCIKHVVRTAMGGGGTRNGGVDVRGDAFQILLITQRIRNITLSLFAKIKDFVKHEECELCEGNAVLVVCRERKSTSFRAKGIRVLFCSVFFPFLTG